MEKLTPEEYIEKLEHMVRDAYSLIIKMGIHDHCECFSEQIYIFLDKYQDLEDLTKQDKQCEP